MRRRIVWTTAAVAVLLVLPAVPATAAQSTLVSPDGDVTKATAIEVELERDFGAERFSEVHASLHRDDERLGRRVELVCEGECDPTDRRVLFTLPGDERFDPASGEPFGADGPLANGGYVLEVELFKDSNFQSDQTFEHELHLAVRPTAPADLGASVDDDEVELTWSPSPEPDIEAYRVERHDGDDWEEIAVTSGSTVVDEPGEGEHRYRVVAERPDGHGDTLTTASDELGVEIETDDEGEDDDGDEGDGEEDGQRDGDDGADPADDDGADDADQSADDGDGDSSSSQDRSGSGSGSASAPETGGNGSGGIPDLAERDGDDGDYSEELDYGGLESDREADGADDVQIATPSGWRGSVDRILDAERIAVPIATGLVMTATGLHLWRWLRIPV